MAEDPLLSKTARALGVRALLPAVYADLISPAARELGDGLATVAKSVKIGLAPLEATVWGYERVREWLHLRVTSLLAERRAKDIQPPPPSIAGPLMLQMVFAAEEPDLREMYASLLATSMDASTRNSAHPSFVSVIQQLTPDEAKILHYLASMDQTWPSWSGNQESSELDTTMRQVCATAQVVDQSKTDFYLENLLRLRVLRRSSSSDAQYNPPEANTYGAFGPSVTVTHVEVIELTSYGRALLDACVAAPNR